MFDLIGPDRAEPEGVCDADRLVLAYYKPGRLRIARAVQMRVIWPMGSSFSLRLTVPTRLAGPPSINLRR
jgi:hypothetical protein